MTDGPNGARGESYVSGIKAACFPCAESIAASFDEEIAYQVGKEVALESKTKSADVLLAPTVCLVRNPLGSLSPPFSFGRNEYLILIVRKADETTRLMVRILTYSAPWVQPMSMVSLESPPVKLGRQYL